MKPMTFETFERFYQLLNPGKEEPEEYYAAEILEVADFATIFGFDADVAYRNVNKRMAEKGCESSHQSKSIEEMIGIAKLLDMHPELSGGGFVNRLNRSIEALEAEFGKLPERECAT
jgi:hypothetical protein